MKKWWIKHFGYGNMHKVKDNLESLTPSISSSTLGDGILINKTLYDIKVLFGGVLVFHYSTYQGSLKVYRYGVWTYLLNEHVKKMKKEQLQQSQLNFSDLEE